MHSAISATKNDLVSVNEYAGLVTTPPEKRIAEVYREYQIRLQRAGAMDFDDLLVNAVAPLPAAP